MRCLEIFFKSLSISVICALKRFESDKISILVGECSITDFGFVEIAISVGVDFGTGISVHVVISEARSVVGDGIGRGGRGGPRGAVKFDLVVQLTTCSC